MKLWFVSVEFSFAWIAFELFESTRFGWRAWHVKWELKFLSCGRTHVSNVRSQGIGGEGFRPLSPCDSLRCQMEVDEHAMGLNDDELVIATEQLAGNEVSTADSIRDVLIKTILNVALPMGIGSILTSLLTENADRNWKIRAHELLRMFAERIALLREAVPPAEYFSSEEFQALLLEAIDQQRTNRYEKKRAMLAQGLAHSGTRAFASERSKETFFRILRDLSPEDIYTLGELAKSTSDTHMGLVLKSQTLQRSVKASALDTRIYRLQGLGLVSTFQRLPTPNVSSSRNIQTPNQLSTFIADALRAEPTIVYQISDFGRRFLRFLTEDTDESKS